MLNIYLKLDEKFINDKDILNIAVKKNGLIIKYTSEAIKNSVFASNKLKNDEEIIMVAIRRDVMAIKYAYDRIKKIISLA